MPIHAVLFDLDGTLLDTAPDLTAALNAQLHIRNRPPVATEAMRALVSDGRRALVSTAFGMPITDPDLPPLINEFLAHYRATNFTETTPFPGVSTLLTTLEERGIPWGIVTNKPGPLTHPLLDTLGWSQRAGCVITPDDVPHPKPAPDPIWKALEQIGTSAAQTLFIGDSLVDVKAAQAAGTPCLLAGFGYTPPEARTWPVAGWLQAPHDILNWL